MSRLAWFHCFSGVAGDMALGALLDAGAPLDGVRRLVARLPVEGWSLDAEPVQRAGLVATRAVVTVEVGPAHRRVSDILALLDAAGLPDGVSGRATRVFHLLGEVEGRLHGVAPGDVELHEVGSVDAIVDVVGVCAALHLLGIDRVAASPVAVGRGTVASAHGALPNPAPATVALLAACGAPVHGLDSARELTTPTGAALLAGLVSDGFGALPPMTLQSVGYGAGTADLPERPNVVQVVIGDPATTPERAHGQPVVELQANVDDVTPEVLAHTVGALLEAGAHDAWVTPIVMKKGRPAHTVHALGDPAGAERLAAVLATETGTLGLRAVRGERWPRRRDEVVVDVDGHPVRVKVADGRVKPEYDDAVAAATALGRPLREVLAQAESAARSPSARAR